LIKLCLFYRFFEASNCLDLTFKDEAGCKRLLSYDISTEYEGKTDSDFFISKTHTLLTEYLSVRAKIYEVYELEASKGKYFDQNVLDWLVKMSPSLEDFTGWGAHWVLTQAVFSGVRFPTLKRLIS
jgi:hypothetical protein